MILSSRIISKNTKGNEHKKLKQGKARRYYKGDNTTMSPEVANDPFITYLENGEEKRVSLADFIVAVQAKGDKLDKAEKIICEDDYGDTEYKLKLIDSTMDRMNQLITQMSFRIKEGRGVAFYKIGYQDNGEPLGLNSTEFKRSLQLISHMASQLSADFAVRNVLSGPEGLLLDLELRKVKKSIQSALKVMLLGSSDSGKSTLVN